MITPLQKDILLRKITEDSDRDWLNIGPEYADLSPGLFSALMRQFEKNGFITIKSSAGKGSDDIAISVEMDADDFLRLGGHCLQEDIFKHNFDKLVLEIEKLEGDIPQSKLDNILNITGVILAGMSAYGSLK